MVVSLEQGSVHPVTPQPVGGPVGQAAAVGVEIEELGLHPLFGEVRCYRGVDRDWLLAPLDLDPVYQQSGGRLPVPKRVLADLRKLAGVLDPFIYVAHDIPTDSVRQLPTNRSEVAAGSSLVKEGAGLSITPELARQLVSLPHVPQRTVDWSRRCGQACDVLLKVVSFTALAAGALAVAPIVLGSMFVDPILFGAFPANPANVEP